jgi:hypothetical protein
MKVITWIIIGIAITGLGYYAYKRKQGSGKSLIDALTEVVKKQAPTFTTESCEVLKKDEVVAYFKSLQLTKGSDIPFVARTNKFSTICNIPDGEYNVALGVYNESLDEISSLKIIVAQKWDPVFATMIGKEDVIVLN